MTVPYYTDESVTLYHGDCLDVLAQLPACSIDAVVTDPPYGLGFMGHQWDQPGRYGALSAQHGGSNISFGGPPHPAMEAGRYDLSRSANALFGEWCQAWATECLRVLKPGGYLLAFGGSRTWHRLAAAVEDAGFELRDSIAWLYGSGFPKSLDVSKAIDKAAGAEREVVGRRSGRAASPRTDMRGGNYANPAADRHLDLSAITAPSTEAAQQWQGWGTALKPAFEPIVVGRKPLTGTVAANVQQHGTGALNIDACRVATSDDLNGGAYAADRTGRAMAPGGAARNVADLGQYQQPSGRWPTNVVLDESQAAELDRQTGILTSGRLDRSRITAQNGEGWRFNGERTGQYEPDSGGASRFFPTFHYEAKAPSSERPTGEDGAAHPTVKPLALMRWLVRLVTAPAGVVLDPFAGSGTTGEACLLEGMRCVLIEREADYLPLIIQRLSKRLQSGFDFSEVPA